VRVRIVINDGVKWHGLTTGFGLVRQFFCGLTGHDDGVKLQRKRMVLECARCGRVTRGWTLDGPEPEPETEQARRRKRSRFLEPARRRS
jgi:hypothetical protein